MISGTFTTTIDNSLYLNGTVDFGEEFASEPTVFIQATGYTYLSSIRCEVTGTTTKQFAFSATKVSASSAVSSMVWKYVAIGF